MRHYSNSLFGAGLRRPLDRSARRLWLARADRARRDGLITATHLEVGRCLVRRLGVDGRLDPSHSTLAADAGCGERTVRRALGRLADLGLLRWVRRLVRTAGWRAAQTSNSYQLDPDGAAPPTPRCPRKINNSGSTATLAAAGRALASSPSPALLLDRGEALAALAAVAARRLEALRLAARPVLVPVVPGASPPRSGSA